MTATFLGRFQKVKDIYDRKYAETSGLDCVTGVFEGSPFVRLHRDSWISDDSGVFFSIWTNRDNEDTRRLHYNLHVLEMRHPSSDAIRSRDFADAFRRGFKPFGHSWPNVRVDYGALNLMQGWMELREKNFDSDVLGLLTRFAEISPLVDRLWQDGAASSTLES